MWNGAVTVGALTVPVKVFTATESHTVRFRELHESDGAPIEHRKVNAKTGREVDKDKIVKGYETSPGRWVVLTDEEIKAAEAPRRKAIEVEHFVAAEEVDPVYLDRAYYLGVGKGGEEAYVTLAAALEKTGRVGIGRVVLRSREQLVALRAGDDGVLRMSTMRFADQLVAPGDLDVEKPKKAPSKQEVEMAEKLIAGLGDQWAPESYEDEYRAKLLTYLGAKAAGKAPKVQAKGEEPEDDVDLLAALKASVGS
ncbi:MAG: Ku protein [Solirubrobacterales bacterium]|nr:Ku protein [Solirubrobacterales bacterium]